MSSVAVYFPDHPLMAELVATRGAVVKSPASFARSVLKDYAKTHWAVDIDPDAMCIMTFTFNPAPALPPYPANVMHSLTLTEALLHHYQLRLNWFTSVIEPYQEGGTPLRLTEKLLPNFPVHTTEGIYRKSSPQVYDATTHVNVRPADFKAFIKNTDLRRHYQSYLDTFWSANGEHYPVLAKAAFIKAAFIQVGENSLRETDKQLALRAVGLSPGEQWSALTPAQLQAVVAADPHVVISPLQIHRYSATDILVIKDMLNPRVLLYIPGNSSPIHGFDTEHAMADWLAEQCRDPRKRLVLETHFKEQDDNDGLFLSGVRKTLEGVAIYPRLLDGVTGAWAPRHCLHSGARIMGDPFVFIRDSLERRLRSDAKTSIRTRGDARLEGLAQGLSRSLIFTGLVALIVPEAIPFIVGLSITLIGAGVVQTVQGKTLEQRVQGLRRVEFGILNALPLAAGKIVGTATKVSASGEIIEPVIASEESVPVTGQKPVPAVAEQPVRPRFAYEPPALRALSPPLRQSLRAFEAPSARIEGQPTIHGPNGMLDIHHSNGRYFLAIHDKAYEVRWNAVARRWQVISPDGAGQTGPFVRQLESDQWDIDDAGLKGGMEPAPAASEPPVAGPSLNTQVKALYPGFSQEQIADFLSQLRANGTSIEIQLARLSMDFQSLERSLERWVSGPLSWGSAGDNLVTPVSVEARRRAADIIKRCWQRQTPVEGIAARHIQGYMLNLAAVPMGDLPYLPGDFSHVTAINLSRTFASQQSVSALVGKCPQLRWLNVENCFLQVIPAAIRGLSQLTRMSLAGNRIVLTADMMNTLRRLPNLRLLNLEFNPLGPLLDVSAMPQLLNLFLRNTGLTALPTGVCDLPALLAVDLRGNLIRTLPDEFFEHENLVQHTLLDGNPLVPQVRGHLALLRAPVLSQPQGDTVDFWLEQIPAMDRVRRRDAWDLFRTQEHAADFFEVIARLEGSADFELSRNAVTERVWQVLEAGAEDVELRSRLVAMAAHPETCSDGAAVMFSNMELEVQVSRAKALAVAGREGPHLLKLVRGLFRLEEVDAIARLDAAGRAGFVEDVEVMLAYRIGLARRLELPISTQAMVYGETASVSPAAIERAGQAVLARETPQAFAAFAAKREFWLTYLEKEYVEDYALCRRPTARQMEALDDRQSEQPLTDAAYKETAEAIMQQRRQDEEALVKQLTIAELAGGARANEV